MLCCLSAGEVVKLTRLGKFDMSDEAARVRWRWLKRLRGNRTGRSSSGQGQMKMLRQLPRLLRFIPGKAQDVRAYFLALQYWLAGSEENLANLVRLSGRPLRRRPARTAARQARAATPVHYPDVGLYHPRARQRICERARASADRAACWHGRSAADAVLRARRQHRHITTA